MEFPEPCPPVAPTFPRRAGGLRHNGITTTRRGKHTTDPAAQRGFLNNCNVESVHEHKIPEFDRNVLETLREPLEAGRITISRAALQADFPAACQLIAAMNPCPCGWRGDPGGRCRCTPEVAARYMRKLSGPLLDRIDIQLEIPALTPAELSARASVTGEASAPIARRVSAARERQLKRQGMTNRELGGRQVDEVCRPDAEGEALLREAGERFGWSARAYYRVLKVARTIADLAGTAMPNAAQIGEAIQYRRAFSSV